MLNTFSHRLCNDISPLIWLPNLMRISALNHLCACSTEFDESGLTTVLGEAIERNMQFSDFPGETTSRLSHIISNELLPKLKNSFIEDDNIDLHQFKFETAINLLDGEEHLLPSLFYTLHSNPEDHYLPSRDSSGSAFHTDFEKCFDTSIREYAERQSLTASWYYGHYQYRLNPDSLLRFLSKDYRHLYSYFTSIGNIFIANISLFENCFVALTGFKSNQNEIVNYSIGCSAHWDPKTAIEKSLAEMYQAYILMHQMHENKHYRQGIDDYIDKIIIPFIEKNNTDTLQKFVVFSKDAEVRELTKLKFDRNHLLSEISNITNHLYLFKRTLTLVDEHCYSTKIWSPDLFQGMVLKHDSSCPPGIKKLISNDRLVNQDELPFG